MVEPVDPLEGRELHRIESSPWTALANHLRLVQPEDGLGQSYEGSGHDSLAPGSSHRRASEIMLTAYPYAVTAPPVTVAAPSNEFAIASGSVKDASNDMGSIFLDISRFLAFIRFHVD